MRRESGAELYFVYNFKGSLEDSKRPVKFVHVRRRDRSARFLAPVHGPVFLGPETSEKWTDGTCDRPACSHSGIVENWSGNWKPCFPGQFLHEKGHAWSSVLSVNIEARAQGFRGRRAPAIPRVSARLKNGLSPRDPAMRNGCPTTSGGNVGDAFEPAIRFRLRTPWRLPASPRNARSVFEFLEARNAIARAGNGLLRPIRIDQAVVPGPAVRPFAYVSDMSFPVRESRLVAVAFNRIWRAPASPARSIQQQPRSGAGVPRPSGGRQASTRRTVPTSAESGRRAPGG